MFSWGLIGVIIFTVLAGLNQTNYNGIDGLEGALLGMGITTPYIVFCLLALVGFLLCIYDVFNDIIKCIIHKIKESLTDYV